MIATETAAPRILLRRTPLLLWLLCTLGLATLTLWIAAWWPAAAFEVSLFLLAGVLLIGKRAVPQQTSFPLLMLGFIVLWGGGQLLTGVTVNRFATERATLQWMTWAALYYAAVCLLGQNARVQTVRLVMVWFGFAVAVEAILQAYLSPGYAYGVFDTGYHDFVMGPIVYHTHYAVLVESILPIALYLVLHSAKRSLVFLGISAVLLTSLVVSASRGGLIIAAGEVLTVVLLSHSRKPKAGRRIAWLLFVLLGVFALLAAIVGFATAAERFHTEALMAGRLQFALSTLHMIRVHPLVGWGLGTWPSVYPAFATFDPGAIVNQAHSDWLQWTAEGGLPVALAMIALAAWACKPAIRSIWGIGVLAVLVHALFDYPFSRPATGAWPVLLLAMVAVTQRSRTTEA